MKRVVVLGVLCAGVWLHGMEDAFLSGGAPARLCQAVELGHAINVLEEREAKAGTQGEGECPGVVYQLLPDELRDGEQKIEKADEFVPMAFLAEKRKKSLSGFSPEKVSAACEELQADADYQALKALWDSRARENSGDYNSLERAVAIKLFRLLACKEKCPSQAEYQKSLKYRRLGIACFILGGIMMVGGPLIVGLVHPHNCL